MHFMPPRIKKKFDKLPVFEETVKTSWKFVIAGAFLFLVGLLTFVWGTPRIGFTIKHQQPIVSNGSLPLIVGGLCLLYGIYGLKNKHGIFRLATKLAAHDEAHAEFERLKSIGYTTRQAKRAIKRKHRKQIQT